MRFISGGVFARARGPNGPRLTLTNSDKKKRSGASQCGQTVAIYLEYVRTSLLL